jgi:hypothetical protein
MFKYIVYKDTQGWGRKMKYNKNQKIVLIVCAILISIVVLTAPKKYKIVQDESVKYANEAGSMAKGRPIILWDFMLQRSLAVFILGAVAFILLADKQ